jgi:hypothetical protein
MRSKRSNLETSGAMMEGAVSKNWVDWRETTGFKPVEAHFQPTQTGPTPPTPSPRAYCRQALKPRARGEGAKGVRGIVRRLKMKLPWLKARGLREDGWDSTNLTKPHPLMEVCKKNHEELILKAVSQSRSRLNPTNGHGWILHIRPTHAPPADSNPTNGSWRILHIRPTDAQPPGSNPTNGSWWILQVRPTRAGRRLDLNDPPTSVGGIRSEASSGCRLTLNDPPTSVGGIESIFREPTFRNCTRLSLTRGSKLVANRRLSLPTTDNGPRTTEDFKESRMNLRSPRTMKTWERTRPACFFSMPPQAGEPPALPGYFRGR